MIAANPYRLSYTVPRCIPVFLFLRRFGRFMLSVFFLFPCSRSLVKFVLLFVLNLLGVKIVKGALDTI